MKLKFDIESQLSLTSGYLTRFVHINGAMSNELGIQIGGTCRVPNVVRQVDDYDYPVLCCTGPYCTPPISGDT